MKGVEASPKAIKKAVSGRERASANVLGPEHSWCCSSSMEANGVPSMRRARSKSREGEVRELWKAGWDIRGQYRVSRIMQTVMQWLKRLSWCLFCCYNGVPETGKGKRFLLTNGSGSPGTQPGIMTASGESLMVGTLGTQKRGLDYSN